MGYLKTAGAPLRLSDLKKIVNYIKEHGIAQFCTLYHLHKDHTIPPDQSLRWGDETEYHIVYFDHENKRVRLLLNSRDLQDGFNSLYKDSVPLVNTFVQPEYGAWMIEAIPKSPYGRVSLRDLAGLEEHFRARREAIAGYLAKFGPVGLSSAVAFPTMGVGSYVERLSAKEIHEKLDKLGACIAPADHHEEKKKSAEAAEEDELPLSTEKNVYSNSIFTFDAAINPHPRFPTLSRNIRERRGEKVTIKVPLFVDKNTKVSSAPTAVDPYPGYIYMDSMAFGMGCCCLQLTFEAQSISHARSLHDQLLVLAPILSALSASSPIYRGRLSDIDLRFTVISQAVDDRTETEREMGKYYVHKSRYSTNSHFISARASARQNDSPAFPVSTEHMATLREAGVDEKLAYHIASLFVRDPLVVYEKAIELDDAKTTAHFENFQSTNWNSIRFKPPPAMESEIGWRVEFRPMDLQLTDFENAALTALVAVLVRVISETAVNFLIPVSRCDENMDRAHHRAAITGEKFCFRTNILSKGKKEDEEEEKEVTDMMTVAEILEGKPDKEYPGLYPLIEQWMAKQSETKPKEKERIRRFMAFLLGRAKGKYRSGAKYIRDFVQRHPDYAHDSIITERISYDLLCHLESLGKEGPETIYASE